MISATIIIIVAAFFGSMAGVIVCVRITSAQLKKLIAEDTDLEKIDIHVTMVEPRD